MKKLKHLMYWLLGNTIACIIIWLIGCYATWSLWIPSKISHISTWEPVERIMFPLLILLLLLCSLIIGILTSKIFKKE